MAKDKKGLPRSRTERRNATVWGQLVGGTHTACCAEGWCSHQLVHCSVSQVLDENKKLCLVSGLFCWFVGCSSFYAMSVAHCMAWDRLCLVTPRCMPRFVLVCRGNHSDVKVYDDDVRGGRFGCGQSCNCVPVFCARRLCPLDIGFVPSLQLTSIHAPCADHWTCATAKLQIGC